VSGNLLKIYKYSGQSGRRSN